VAFARLRLFRVSWWAVNLLLAISMAALVYAGVWEFSVSKYLDGFSDSIVPNSAPPVQKVEAILKWMRVGANREVATDPEALDLRDPETTLVYQQLLAVCGTATNAFLNLARSSDLQVRRLLLLGPDHRTKHVVAEVLIEGRWVIVDPAYRTLMRDKRGRLLTRSELRDPATFAEATQGIPNYPREYSYESIAHVRVARLPLEGLQLRRILERVYPGWDESFDWSLLLERESAAALALAVFSTCIFIVLRFALGWYADRRLRVHRTHLREKVLRVGAALFTSPEIK
jgi:hypothetical protein